MEAAVTVSDLLITNNTVATSAKTTTGTTTTAVITLFKHFVQYVCAAFIIFSDSMSSLEAISGFKIEIDIVQNIIKDCTHLANSGKTIILCWIPSHVNIRGNERADSAAKSAVSLPITNNEASST